MIDGKRIAVMPRPDDRHSTRPSGAPVGIVASDPFEDALGTRILGSGALAGGMPPCQRVSNRVLTPIQDLLRSCRLFEHHAGRRANSRRMPEAPALLPSASAEVRGGAAGCI
jgi:hypothetical protein